MGTNAKKDTYAGAEMLTTFEIQVCSKDGRLLREYTLNRHNDGVCTLNDAESCACKNLADHHGEPLVVVVTEETLTKMRQVQTDCETGKKRS